MNKLGEIITMVLVSSSVFIALDSAKRNFRPETPVPAVNNAQAAQEKDLLLPARAPEPDWTKPDNTGMRDAIRDNAIKATAPADTGGNAIAYINGSEARSNPPVSNRAGYLTDLGDDKDIVVSSVFNSEAAVRKSMTASIDELKSEDKPVLFSSLMREAAGGFFYVIRTEPSGATTARVNPGIGRSEQLYINKMINAAARLENECRGDLQDDNK